MVLFKQLVSIAAGMYHWAAVNGDHGKPRVVVNGGGSQTGDAWLTGGSRWSWWLTRVHHNGQTRVGWGGSQTRVIRGGGWSTAIVVEWMGKVCQTGQMRVG